MATTTDTKALRSMREAVGAMRREVDQAISSLTATRERLSTLAFGLDLAVKAEDERRAEGK